MTTFSIAWKSSTQTRKQRKYRHNAPLHIRQKFVHVHLSKSLREKYTCRQVGVRKGDKVAILRGTYKGKEGTVERVALKNTKVYITGIDIERKDGSKHLVPIEPSNLMITVLEMKDTKRKKKLESTKNVTKNVTKDATKEASNPKIKTKTKIPEEIKK